MPTAYSSVFQPFCCHGTLHKREGHSRNPMHWSVTYTGLKLRGVYGLNFLAEQSPCEDDKASKDDQY